MLYISDIEVCILVTLKNSKRSTVFCAPLYFLFFCFTVYSIHFNSRGVLLLSSALSVAFGSKNRHLIRDYYLSTSEYYFCQSRTSLQLDLLFEKILQNSNNNKAYNYYPSIHDSRFFHIFFGFRYHICYIFFNSFNG